MGASVQLEGKAGRESAARSERVWSISAGGAEPERADGGEESARVREVAPPCVSECAEWVGVRGPELKK